MGRYPGTFLAEHPGEVVRDLAEETGTATLIGFVLDSDAVDVHAFGEKSGPWRACLAWESMAAYVDDGGAELVSRFLASEEAARRAALWAVEAGLRPHAGLLGAAFAVAETSMFVENLFDDLVSALGISPATPRPLTGRTDMRQRARRAMRPANPLDTFVNEFAVPVLSAAGFTKRARTFRRLNDLGDQSVVMIRSWSSGFFLDVGVAHKPVWDLQRVHFGESELGFTPATFGYGTWSRRWHPGDGMDWDLPEDSAKREAIGRLFADTLTNDVIPTLERLLDRRAFVDVMRGRTPNSRYVTQMDAEDEVRLLAGLGPSMSLSDTLAEIGRRESAAGLATWVQERLAELGVSGAAWHDQARSTRTRFESLLDVEIGPSLRTAGFARTGSGFRRVSTHGDEIRLDLAFSATTTPDSLRLYVDTGIVPAGERRWQEHLGALHPDADRLPFRQVAWCGATVEPPEQGRLPGGTLHELGGNPWVFDRATEVSLLRFLGHRLVSEVDRLEPFLNRGLLRQHFVERGGFVSRIKLLVDEGPSDILEHALRDAEKNLHPLNRELAAWGRHELARRTS